MSSQDFLFINIGAAVVFIVWYLSARKKTTRQPVKLNLHAKDSAPVTLPAANKQDHSQASKASLNTNVPINIQEAHRIRDQKNAQANVKLKNLNQFFNYNGHTWDAYEVLGVPGGSSLEKVTQAYQEALKSTNKESHVFLETAYKAILHKL